MAIPPILNGTGAPASESGVPSYNAVWNGSQWIPATAGSGTAGTPAGGVQSVQGVASGTPIPVSQPGLSGQPLQSVTTVGVTPAPLPTTAVAGRVCMDIQAWEGNTVPIFVGGATVTARVVGAVPAATDGIMVLPGATYRTPPLAASSVLYSRATAASQYATALEVPAT